MWKFIQWLCPVIFPLWKYLLTQQMQHEFLPLRDLHFSFICFNSPTLAGKSFFKMSSHKNMASKLGLNLNQNRNDWKQKIISKVCKHLGTTEFYISGMHNILNIRRKLQCIMEISLNRTSLTSWEKWNICHISQ